MFNYLNPTPVLSAAIMEKNLKPTKTKKTKQQQHHSTKES